MKSKKDCLNASGVEIFKRVVLYYYSRMETAGLRKQRIHLKMLLFGPNIK